MSAMLVGPLFAPDVRNPQVGWAGLEACTRGFGMRPALLNNGMKRVRAVSHCFCRLWPFLPYRIHHRAACSLGPTACWRRINATNLPPWLRILAYPVGPRVCLDRPHAVGAALCRPPGRLGSAQGRGGPLGAHQLAAGGLWAKGYAAWSGTGAGCVWDDTVRAAVSATDAHTNINVSGIGVSCRATATWPLCLWTARMQPTAAWPPATSRRVGLALLVTTRPKTCSRL